MWHKIFKYILVFIFVISHWQGIKAYKASQRLIRRPYEDFNHSDHFSGINQSRRDFVHSGLCSQGQEYSKQARGEPEDIKERKDQGRILVYLYLNLVYLYPRIKTFSFPKSDKMPIWVIQYFKRRNWYCKVILTLQRWHGYCIIKYFMVRKIFSRLSPHLADHLSLYIIISENCIFLKVYISLCT